MSQNKIFHSKASKHTKSSRFKLAAVPILALGVNTPVMAQGISVASSSRSGNGRKKYYTEEISSSYSESRRSFNTFSVSGSVATTSSAVLDEPTDESIISAVKWLKKTIRNNNKTSVAISGDVDAWCESSGAWAGIQFTATCTAGYCTDTTHNYSCAFDSSCTGAPLSSNNAPTNIGLSANTINQSSTSGGATVGSLSTTDADGGDSHTYSLVNNGTSANGSCGASGDDNNSSFSISSSNLQTASSLSAGSYNICIQTHDGTTSYQKSFSVTVNDDVAPSGHSVSFDDSTINASEVSSQSFTFASAEVGATYSYTVSSSGGGTNVTGSGTLSTATDQITGLNLSGLSDGTLTLSVVVTDTSANAAVAVTDTATLDVTAPSGHSVSLDNSTYNATDAASASFTFASAEVGASYSYSISSSGGGTPVTGSGTLSTATDQITGVDISGLSDGTLTISVVVTDPAGNAATAVTDTATLDATAPSGHSVSLDNSTYNAT
ncbi:hypothetical protein, partial [Gynuella sp.]|uniref:hypothetical protein n=1 Tax=Gynuella sp. TaxID=2969146 RepID=UPI003D0E5338